MIQAIQTAHGLAETQVPSKGETASGLLDILFDTSSNSSSLMATRHPVRVAGCHANISKFVLLGPRFGGKPIRVAFLGGIGDHGSLAGPSAIARLLLEAELRSTLVRDYALFAYPIVNVFEHTEGVSRPEGFERRLATGKSDSDIRFFQTELEKWRFDGLVTVRTDCHADGFHAVVRSALIAKEVVAPALDVVAKIVPIGKRPILVRPGDVRSRRADSADGRLTPPPVELFAPGSASKDERIRSLFIASHEILRSYRRMLCHGDGI